MQDELTAVLQVRWEESLRERAALDPHSPVPLLEPFRDSIADTGAIALPTGDPGAHRMLAREQISQISPSMTTAPIPRVG